MGRHGGRSAEGAGWGGGPGRGAPSGRVLRVLLAGEESWREVLAGALAANAAIEVAGQASAGEEALTKARELQPDVVALDLGLLRELAARRPAPGEAPHPGLTRRELEVLSLVAQSKTNKQIAAQLFISENTVKNHIRNVLEKLHLHSRMEAVTWAWRNRLLGPGGPE